MPDPLCHHAASPLVHEIPFADPLHIFSLVPDTTGALFLDSANHAHPFQDTNRYSYIVFSPFKTFTLKDHILLETGAPIQDPFAFLKQELSFFRLKKIERLPPFQGGAAGYFSYDIAHYIETLPHATDDMKFPDIAIGLYDVVISFDHHSQQSWIISTGFPETDPDKRRARAKIRLSEIETILENTPYEVSVHPASFCDPADILSLFNEEKYHHIVKQSQDYILEGDIFEVNLSQRFVVKPSLPFSSFELYKKLRAINPAPFAAYMNWGSLIIASASPERFISLSEGRVQTRPIKGTLARGQTPEEDARLADTLLNSKKDRAENVMIVDLMRNDLSRVCEDDSVTVETLCGLESYAKVHHLVSVIQGTLKPSVDAVDLLKVTLPGGSITGAPKIRAMEIIAELEPHARGPYCGSLGFISFNGDMDTSIIIRTYIIQDGIITFQAGGAITLNSDPRKEYQETLDKACALKQALTES